LLSKFVLEAENTSQRTTKEALREPQTE